VALTIGAVMRLSYTGPELEDRNTIDQLGAAAQQFYVKYNFYPPSRLFLSNNRAHYNDGTRPANVSKELAEASLGYLHRMFTNLQWSGIDWSGGAWTTANNGVILEGDQCLVFFLGGIPSNGAPQGFAADGRNPTALGGNNRVKFFQFKNERLKVRSNSPFLSYYNVWDDKSQPYAYFSSYSGIGGAENGYNKFFASTTPGSSDCNGLGVWPYAETNSPRMTYLNPKTFQIISAGPDGKFGTGTNVSASPVSGFWTARTAGTAATADGRDDLSNFHGQRLGAE
jgi:hypothetical protein